VEDIPLLTGNAFSHKTQKYMNSIFIRRGMCSKGRVVISPLARSLIVLIPRSASLTCSLAAVVLHSSLGTRSLICSNSPSIRIVPTVNPACAYTWTTRSICLAKLLAVLTGTCSAVINLIRLDTVIRKAVPSTKKTSAARVTTLLCSASEQGIAT